MLKKILILTSVIFVMFSCSNSVLTGPKLGEKGDSLEFQTTKSSPDIVKLIKAESLYTSHYGIPAVSRTFLIKVKNIDYNKKVYIHHSKLDNTWVDIPGSYKGQAEDGYEIWEVNINWNAYAYSDYNYGDQFVVKFEANGNTYWDNNYNNNYSLEKGAGILLGNDVNVLKNGIYKYDSYENGNTNFYGSIDVKNIAYDKTVTVVYSTDNWNTTRTVNASYSSYYVVPYGATIYSPNAQGVERWSFSIDFGYHADSIQFAVAYDVDGTTYWDNNYGRNYTLQ